MKNIKDRQRNNFKYRNKLIKNATKEELIFKKWLDQCGINYRFQKGFLKPFHRIVDFYIPKKKVIIEIDGGYHKDTYKKDMNKDATWETMGYKTIRIPNHRIVDSPEHKKEVLFYLGVFL